MTKNELISLLKMDMMDSVRKRDLTNLMGHSQEYGYYNGQFRAYEAVIGLLMTVNIETLSSEDARNFER